MFGYTPMLEEALTYGEMCFSYVDLREDKQQSPDTFVREMESMHSSRGLLGESSKEFTTPVKDVWQNSGRNSEGFAQTPAFHRQCDVEFQRYLQRIWKRYRQ